MGNLGKTQRFRMYVQAVYGSGASLTYLRVV